MEVNKVKRLLRGMFDANKGRFRHVRSVAIFSCQSPTSAEIKVVGESKNPNFREYLEKYEHTTIQAWNAKSMIEAREMLRRYRYRIVDGLYEEHEKSFIVFNMTRGDVEDFNKRFYQQAYIFINLMDKIDPKVGSKHLG